MLSAAPPPPVIHIDLLGFGEVQIEVLVLAPLIQDAPLLPVPVASLQHFNITTGGSLSRFQSHSAVFRPRYWMTSQEATMMLNAELYPPISVPSLPG